MEILNEEDVSTVETKRILEERKKERDLVYEQKICLEYLERLPKLTQKQAEDLAEELAKIPVMKPRYINIVISLLPDTEEEVESLFSKERTNLKKEEVKQIAGIVSKAKR
ncbi:MAG: hypothetical protein HY368_00135 [Candidatus Aenigmarchaeota archaeon]|nr:hypothetical protein [Candidatus Aenigmarchaeota archaeon]